MKKIMIGIIIMVIMLQGCSNVIEETKQIEQEIQREHPQTPEEIEVIEETQIEGTESDPIEEVMVEKGIFEKEFVKHDVEGDCWIVYGDKVYDYSNAKMHPNMAKTFYAYCGQLSGFEEGAKAKHSKSSDDRVDNYGEYLGDLI